VNSLAENGAETEETKQQRRIDISFPLVTVRTQIFGSIFDKFGSFRFSRWISTIALVIVPIVAAIGLFLLSSSLFTLLWTAEARTMTRELGPASYLLLPGINPILPIIYGWLAIVCAIVVHEGAHGVIARNRGLDVKSSGLLFFLIIPIGAFVDVDEDQIAKAKPGSSLRVMAAGVAGNVIVAIVCIIAVILVVNSLTPIVDGVYVYDVTMGMPADSAGLLPGDVFVSVDSVPINNFDTLNSTLAHLNAGDLIDVTMERGKDWADRFSTTINLTESDGRAVMGVTLGDLRTADRLDFYKTVNLDTVSLYLVPPSLAPGVVPFSDSLIPFYSSPLGSEWHVYANFFFWIWFVNVNVAIFNALPIYPLDGGRMFDISLKSVLSKKKKKKTISRITYGVTIAIVGIILALIVIPFIF